MRNRIQFAVALASVLAPLLAMPLAGQQQPGAPQGAGQPSGRGGAEAGSAQGPGLNGGVPRGGNEPQGPGRSGAAGRGRGPALPAGPAPRAADGHALLGFPSSNGERGVWLPGQGGNQTLVQDDTKVPFQPWARAVYNDRQKNQLEPHTRCKPSGFARQFLTPYGVEIVEMPQMERVFIFDIGGPHTYREIFLDGRTHPASLQPTAYGHSIGWWEGDTLVVDTVGYSENFWIDRRGTPTTEQLHTIERFTRTDARTVRYETIVDDPGAYTARWQGSFNFSLESGTELFEYVCQQANYAGNLMVGAMESVDRTSTIVP